jgi:3-methyladenine DNA glycosylase Mpg
MNHLNAFCFNASRLLFYMPNKSYVYYIHGHYESEINNGQSFYAALDSAVSRQRKEENKGSRANHNRRQQHAKKMARGGGFPG